MRNDLAVTLHHLGDDAGCLKVLEPLKELAALTEEQVRKEHGIEPMLVGDWVSIAGATRTNWKLCATTKTEVGATSPSNGAASGPPAFHPIVMAPQRMLGGVIDHRWVKPDDVPKTYKGKPPSFDCDFKVRRMEMGGLKGGESYHLFTREVAVGTGTGSRISYRCDGAANDYYEIDIKPAGKEGKAWRYATDGAWNVVPRVAKKVKGNYVVDVDGDGKDDLLRLTTKKKKGKPAEGQGEGEGEEGEPPTKVVTYTLEMNGKKLPVATFDLDGVYASEASVELVDLNGDGVLDFVFLVEGHNTSLSVVDVASGKAADVLGYYSGD
jgi:hypothetical protein